MTFKEDYSLIEHKEYSELELKNKFEGEFEKLIEISSIKRILFVEEKKSVMYSFSFVGVIILNSMVVNFLPKFLINEVEKLDKNIIDLLLKVIQKYQKKLISQEINQEHYLEEQDFMLFGTISYMYENYFNYGLYLIEQEVDVKSPDYLIDWQDTIDLTEPYLNQDNTPIYLDLISINTETDSYAKITDIHRFIINSCSSITETHNLDLLFGWPVLKFETIYEWEENIEEAKEIIEQTMQKEYNDEKILLLKNMLFYLTQIDSLTFTKRELVVGTKYFQYIWEDICSNILTSDKRIAENITSPIWSLKGEVYKTDAKLIPDTLRVLNYQGIKHLLILDAKYYYIEWKNDTKTIVGQPGVSDITKQYLYQKALEEYAKKMNIDIIHNAFLIPKFNSHSGVIGRVKFDFVSDLQSIKIIHLNALEMFGYYVKSVRLKDSFIYDLLQSN